MIRLVFAFLLLLVELPAYAQEGKAVGPNPPAGLFTTNGALKGNGSGTVSQAACADLSNGAAGCSASLPLSASNGGTGNSGGAFSTYTPTAVFSQSTGAVTYTSTGRYQQVGKLVNFQVIINITGTFTVGALTTISLPVQAANQVAIWNIPGREDASTGLTWTGTINQNGTTMAAENYLNSPAVLTGQQLSFSGYYESQ